MAVRTKNKVRDKRLSLLADSHFEVCSVQIPDAKLVTVGMCMPPGITSFHVKVFQDTLSNAWDIVLDSRPLHRLIVAGDYHWYGMSFLNLNFSLESIMTGPTRKTACLNLIFVVLLLEYYNSERVELGHPIGSSDHNCILARSGKVTKTRSIKKHVLYDLWLSHKLAFGDF